MTELKITRAHTPLRGVVNVPGDKSISQRALILAALAAGETRIENFLRAGDTQATLDLLRVCGIEINELDATTLTVKGNGLRGLREPETILDCRGSGTTMRLLAGALAAQDLFAVLDGSAALRARPMKRVVEPLRAMGATIFGRANDTRAPLAMRGGNLRGIEYTLPVASAQVKSALLLAGLNARGATTLHEPSASRDHTERMLREFGARVEKISEMSVRVFPSSVLRSPSSLRVPNDFSSAAFFIVAALLMPQSEIVLPNVGVNPTRTGLIDILEQMGAPIERENPREENGEPRADLRVRANERLRGTTIGGEIIPRLIDEVPILAVLATQAEGETIVRDASELRVKESDRISLLARDLRAFGVNIEERADGFIIRGPTRLCGARVAAHHDHRLAMSFAVAGWIAEGETVIEGWECVADSFPNFEHALLG